MITLITAVPGSGKTLLAVGKIVEFLTEGRMVFHNINGLQKDKLPNNHLLFDAPDDWRETPHGSVVIYDECQQPHLYPATAKSGQVTDERLTSMEIHRHSGHDLIFICQAPTFVHHHVRKLVGEHIHLYRGGGSKIVARYTWSHTCDNPNDRREQERADFTPFKFNKDHFQLYKSATVHTHKLKIPKKIIVIFGFVGVIFLFSIYSLSSSKFMPWTDSVSSPPSPPGAQALAARAEPTTSPLHDVPNDRPLSGCMSSESKGCKCWDIDLKPLFMPKAQCLAIMKGPLPRVISQGSDNKRQS